MAGDIDAMCQSEPQASQALNKQFGVEIMKPYDTPIGMPVRSLVFSEALYKERPDVAERTMKLFIEATDTFIKHPEIAEKYVIESMFKGQITPRDYKDAIGNSPFSYEITVEHVQTTTDMMQKFGVGRMTTPPKASEWVKTDLLEKALASLKKAGN